MIEILHAPVALSTVLGIHCHRCLTVLAEQQLLRTLLDLLFSARPLLHHHRIWRVNVRAYERSYQAYGQRHRENNSENYGCDLLLNFGSDHYVKYDGLKCDYDVTADLGRRWHAAEGIYHFVLWFRHLFMIVFSIYITNRDVFLNNLVDLSMGLWGIEEITMI